VLTYRWSDESQILRSMEQRKSEVGGVSMGLWAGRSVCELPFISHRFADLCRLLIENRIDEPTWIREGCDDVVKETCGTEGEKNVL
jgi:hypothetical protein